jgi:hypothetical protein
VRPLVTVAFTVTFLWLTVTGVVPIDGFLTMTTAVLSFWFAQRGNPK